MKAKSGRFSKRCLAGAVHGALVLMAFAPAAYAADADDAVPDLTKPTNRVEVGVGNVSESSAKFGEYNGLNKKGAYAIGNLDIRGGAYGSATDPTRWSITGTDLGLETRD